MERTLGAVIWSARKNMGFTVNQFIEKLTKKISHSYLTKVELQDEIPRKELLLDIARVLTLDEEEVLELAREGKRKKLEKKLLREY